MSEPVDADSWDRPAVPTPDRATTATQRRTIAVLSGAQVLTGVGIGAGVSAGSLLVAELSGSEGMAGLAQTCGVVGAALAAGPLAWMSSRKGRRIGLATGLWIAVAGSVVVIAGAVAGWVLLALLGSFGVGAASAVGYQARYAASDLATPHHMARDLGFVVWATTVGAVLGPNLMEPASRLADSLSLPPLAGPYLVTVSAVTLAAVVIVGMLRPDPLLEARGRARDRARDQPGQSEHDEQPSSGGMLADLGQGWRVVRASPGAVTGVTAIAVGHVVMIMVMVMTPVHMQHVDVMLQVIGLVISVHILGMYALAPVVGWVADRRGSVVVIGAGAVLLAVSTLVSGTAAGDQVPQLGAGLFLLGLGWSCTLVGGSALLSASVPGEHRPAAQGMGDTVMNVAAALGGAAAGVIVFAASYAWLNVAAALCLVPLVVVLWRYQRGRRRGGPRRRVGAGVRTPVR